MPLLHPPHTPFSPPSVRPSLPGFPDFHTGICQGQPAPTLGFPPTWDLARLRMCLASALLRKLWYTKARGDHDKVWILEGWGWGCSGWGWGPCA